MSYIFLIAFILLGQLQSPLLRKRNVSDSELEVLSEQLLRESEPNLFPHIEVSLQNSTSSRSRSDDADFPLLSMNESIIFKVPTIEKMRALFDNYKMDVSEKEDVTPHKLREDEDFLNAVLDTKVMQTAMYFLYSKDLVHSNRSSQFDLLKRLWFDMYPRTRDGNVGSSGFEHVFLNEMKRGSPIGLHNWIYYYHKENRTGTVHDVDYNGFINNLYMGNKGQIIKFRMSFKGKSKPVNSMFIGTLPEFELAIYTVCFVMNRKKCPVCLDGKKFKIQTYPFKYLGKSKVGAAYPVI